MTYIFLGLLIFCAHLFNAWFSSKRIPDVLLLMGIGIIAGPVTGWISTDSLKDIGPVLASLTLLFILFDSGTDMRLDMVRKYWTGVVQVTFLSFIISMVATTITGIALIGLSWQSSLILGAMVSGTAAAIVIPLVRQMRVSDKTRVTLTLESAISGMLCIVITLVLIEGVKLGNIQVGTLIGRVLASILMAVIIGIVGGIVWSSIMERVRKLQNSMFMTPAFVFVVYGVTELLGYSGAIASLAFGLVLGNPAYFDMPFLHKLKFGPTAPLMDSEKSFYKEFVFILKTYFFVYIGLCIPFRDGWALIYGASLAAILFAVRFILIALVGRKNTANDRLIVSMMIPKGLVSAVLASIPEQVNIAAGCIVIHHATFIKQISYSVIFFSIVFCSLLVLATRNRLMKGAEELSPSTPA